MFWFDSAHGIWEQMRKLFFRSKRLGINFLFAFTASTIRAFERTKPPPRGPDQLQYP